jgi:hypothetical protein
MRKDLLKGLTEQQISKVRSCKNPSEILALAKEEGVELTDEQLEAINGGACSDSTDKSTDNGKRKIDS